MTASDQRLVCRAAAVLVGVGVCIGVLFVATAYTRGTLPGPAWATVATLLATCLLPFALFGVAQLSPAGRQLVPLWGEREDGWMLVHVFAMLVAVLFALAASGADLPAPMLGTALSLVAVVLFFMRRRQLARSSSHRLEPGFE